MDENFVLLLDIYGELLPKSQKTALDLKYNSDLSLAEIAEEMGGISRQSVNDFLKKGKQRLLELEGVLGNALRFTVIAGELAGAEETLSELARDFEDERFAKLRKSLLRIQEEL